MIGRRLPPVTENPARCAPGAGWTRLLGPMQMYYLIASSYWPITIPLTLEKVAYENKELGWGEA
jgi:hypothetical protein